MRCCRVIKPSCSPRSLCASQAPSFPGPGFRLSGFEQFANYCVVTSTACQLFAVLETDHVLTAVAGVELLNLRHIHNQAAVDTRECPRRHPFFDLPDRLPKTVYLTSCVDLNVIRGGFDPINLIRFEEDNPTFAFHDQPFR